MADAELRRERPLTLFTRSVQQSYLDHVGIGQFRPAMPLANLRSGVADLVGYVVGGRAVAQVRETVITLASGTVTDLHAVRWPKERAGNQCGNAPGRSLAIVAPMNSPVAVAVDALSEHVAADAVPLADVGDPRLRGARDERARLLRRRKCDRVYTPLAATVVACWLLAAGCWLRRRRAPGGKHARVADGGRSRGDDTDTARARCQPFGHAGVGAADDQSGGRCLRPNR